MSRDVSKRWESGLDVSNRSEIWQASLRIRAIHAECAISIVAKTYHKIYPSEIRQLAFSVNDAIATENWVDIDSGNCFVSDDAKPVPEPVSTYHRRGSVTFIWDIFQKYLSHQSLKSSWKLLI